jgi:serine/threonine protein kinase
VIRALHEYLAELEAGRAPDRQEFLDRHAPVAQALAECLDGLEFVHGAACRLHSAAGQPAGAARSAEAFEPARLLGDYEVVRELGRGGMGVVYEAVQLSLGRRVALKVLPLAGALDARQLQRFKREAQAAAQLHHTHIVPVYAVGCERGVHFYAMQLSYGQSLAALLGELRQLAGRGGQPAAASLPADLASGWPGPASARGREPGAPSPAPRAGAGAAAADTVTLPAAARPTERPARGLESFQGVARLGVQAAEALEHAHQCGVVHRDIKPANLLVDGRGNLWVADFGLAHFHGEAGLTLSGDLLGTLRYMSPEQALGTREGIDHRTDIYSLGVTLYELLTLEPAVAGRDRQEVLRQIERHEPVPPRRRNKAIPRDLETIVLKAMAKEPNARYATAQELANDLRRFLEDRPIQARRPSLWQRARKWGRRHRPVVMASAVAAAVIIVLGVAGLAVSNVLITLERNEAQRQSQRAEHNLALARQAMDQIYRVEVAEKRLFRDPRQASQDRALVQKLVGFYEALTAENATDPATRYGAATAYRSVANLYHLDGRRQQAEQAFREANTLLERLLGEFPDNPDYRRQLAASYSDLAFLLEHAAGRLGEAETWYRRAQEQFQQLVADFPGAADDRAALAHVYNGLGNVLNRAGRLQEAEAAYRQAQGLLEELDQRFPPNRVYRESLASGYTNLGPLLLPREPVQAEASLHRSVGLWETIAADFPTEYSHKSRAAAVQNLALLLCRQAKLAEACPLFRHAVILYRQALERRPLDSECRGQLNNAILLFTDVLIKLGGHEEAAATAAELAAVNPQSWEECCRAANLVADCIAPALKDERLSPSQRQVAVQVYGFQIRSLLREADARGGGDPTARLAINLLRRKLDRGQKDQTAQPERPEE